MSIVTNVSLYLMAGESYMLEIPVTPSNYYGYFPRKGTLSTAATGKNNEVTLQNGFYVENEEVGEITKQYTDKVAIDYLHKYSTDNTIWFLSVTGERVKITISTMPVHDHASVNTGGPAYGTYYSGRNKAEEEST